MSSCKDCLSYKVCECRYDNIICNHFKDSNRFVELPCKVGDTVYEIQADNTIKKWFVYGIIKYIDEEWKVRAKNNKNKYAYIDRSFTFGCFGKTVFLTREEAEKALKGM